jgi:uncharacterized surface protein with fasciclin (FAS1) repeats
MFPRNSHAFNGKKLFVKLAWLISIIGVTTMIASPVLARKFFYPRLALFQPSAYRNYPYRNSNSTIADTLAKDGKYANLVDELKEAGLFDTLKKPGYFTIFAPTDEAFNALPDNVFKQYSKPENRIKVLKNHLISGQITPEQVNSGLIKTLEGSQVKITDTPDGTVKLNDANAKHPSTTTTNGVIVEIDRLLLPSDF